MVKKKEVAPSENVKDLNHVLIKMIENPREKVNCYDYILSSVSVENLKSAHDANYSYTEIARELVEAGLKTTRNIKTIAKDISALIRDNDEWRIPRRK